jgi:drug/metabolite transporter (DMT)-like permease
MLVLDEEIGWRTLIGGAMIMLGISFIVVRRTRKTIPALGMNKSGREACPRS